MIKQTKIYYGILSNNRTELLKKTINSILTSNIKDFGIVISDNCSDDSTILFLKSLLNNPNIHIIFNKDKSLEKNKSYGRNRIIDKVLELSKGDSNTYLRFIDDDDYFNSIGLKLEYNKISESKNKDIYFVKRVTRENFNTFNKNRDVNPNLMFEGTHTIYINNRLLKEYPNIRYDEINHPIYKEDLIFFVTLISKVFSYDDFEDNEVLKLDLDFSYYYVKTCRLTQNELKTLNSYEDMNKLQSKLMKSLISILKSKNKILKKELYYLLIDYMKYTEYEKKILLEKNIIDKKESYYDFIHRFAIR